MATETREEMERKIKALRNDIEIATRNEQFDKSAQEIKAVYDSFVKAGFTEEQAWEIIKIQMAKQ